MKISDSIQDLIQIDWEKEQREEHVIATGIIGVIPVDALFSPVRRVSFEVGNTRVDQSTDYDELILKIETYNF